MGWLHERTGIPTVALLPMVRHTLPEEDTLHHRAQPDMQQINLALIVYPYGQQS